MITATYEHTRIRKQAYKQANKKQIKNKSTKINWYDIF